MGDKKDRKSQLQTVCFLNKKGIQGNDEASMINKFVIKIPKTAVAP